MIKFFRNIRQNLLSGNKPKSPKGRLSKYLIYAIGEIALVMIGILLALQVNNWNENRKTQAKNYQLLHKVHEELALNIRSSNQAQSFYISRHPDFRRVLKKEVNSEDYEKSNLGGLLHRVRLVNVSDQDASSLINFDNDKGRKQDSLVSRIVELYKTITPRLNEWDNRMSNGYFEYNEMLKKTQEWYYRRYIGEMINADFSFYLDNPFYLNEVANYWIRAMNHHGHNYRFNKAAKSIYLDLSVYLEKDIDSTLIGTIDKNKHYIGTYSYQDDIIEIKEQGNRLVYIMKNKGPEPYNFYPDSDSTFVLDFRFGKLIKNKEQDITGMELSIGARGEPLVYSKIN